MTNPSHTEKGSKDRSWSQWMIRKQRWGKHYGCAEDSGSSVWTGILDIAGHCLPEGSSFLQISWAMLEGSPLLVTTKIGLKKTPGRGTNEPTV